MQRGVQTILQWNTRHVQLDLLCLCIGQLKHVYSVTAVIVPHKELAQLLLLVKDIAWCGIGLPCWYVGH